MRSQSQQAVSKLFAIAESQQGFFTARQAKEAGYKDNTHSYHVRSGNWLKIHRGIYRLANFPQTERPDLIIWALWSSNRKGELQGAYSHQTALSIHNLSDIMPDKLHMTVPPTFRRNSAIPEILILYRKKLAQDRKVLVDGILVTTPYQTLLDIIEEAKISHDLIFQAFQIASKEGIISRSMLMKLLNERAVLESSIYTYLRELL